MKPLKHRTCPTSPIEANAIELLRSIERYQPPAGQKQRVRVRILETPVLRRLTFRHPAMVAAIVLVAAGASAALGRQWLIRSSASTSVATQLDNQPVSSTRNPQVVEHSTVIPNTISAGSASSDVPRSTLEDFDRTSAEVSSRSEGSARTDSTLRSTPASEKALVFDAMRALRREGQPMRAARLLDEYLRRYPRGSLAEEALALAIEAASATADTRARSYADRYLASYPRGRFRSAAERARSRFAP